MDENLQVEIQYRLECAFFKGVESAREGIQSVVIGEDSPDILEDWIGDKPVMRIQFFADGGDMSVGIFPTSGWEVSSDQSGTVLEELMSLQCDAVQNALNYYIKEIEDGNLDSLGRVVSAMQRMDHVKAAIRDEGKE